MAFEEESRRSTGQEVKAIALHHYIGLTGLEESKAAALFPMALSEGDSLASSALRMAEREALRGIDQ